MNDVYMITDVSKEDAYYDWKDKLVGIFITPNPNLSIEPLPYKNARSWWKGGASVVLDLKGGGEGRETFNFSKIKIKRVRIPKVTL